MRDEAEEAVARGTGRAPRRLTPSRRAGKAPESARRPGTQSPTRQPTPGDTDTTPAGKALDERLKDASRNFERDRFVDAQRILRPLAQRNPAAATVRELYGLTLYRLGRWRDAIRELEAFRALTGSSEQHPVLADSYRALGRYTEVDELWHELRERSPGAELVAEGRIVAAGALADQDRLADAIRLLEPAVRPTRRPRTHHLRLAYALGDLYERAGDVPKARQLFTRVAAVDPGLADVEQRLRALG